MFYVMLLLLFFGSAILYYLKRTRSVKKTEFDPAPKFSDPDDVWKKEISFSNKEVKRQILQDLLEPASAARVHQDMQNLFSELLCDPTMTSKDWREWLPRFEAADECYAKALSPNVPFERLADKVKKIMA